MAKKTKKTTKEAFFTDGDRFDYEIRIYKADPKVTKSYGILANATVTLNDAIAITGIVIRENRKKKGDDPWVSFPSKTYEKDGETQYKDYVFPVSKEAREEIITAILDAYDDISD